MSHELEKRDLINLLPVEVLREIFNFLNFRDLLLSRLVCHRWLDVIRDQTPYHLEPKVVFNHCIINPSSEPVKIFANSSFKCYKLAIGNRVTFAQGAGHYQVVSRSFWQKFGKDLRQLTIHYSESNLDNDEEFYHKELSIADVIQILQCTPNLEELKIQNKKKDKSEFFHDALQKLSPNDRQLLQTNLRNVKKLVVCGNRFNETQFRDLTALMPSLEEVDLGNVALDFAESELTSREGFNNNGPLIEFCCARAGILKALSLTNTVYYNRPYYRPFLGDVGRVPGLKLKQLSCSIWHLTLNEWKEFLEQQNEIETLFLNDSDQLEGSLEATVQLLPHLKTLILHEGLEPVNIFDCIKRLPKLESVCFGCDTTYDFKGPLTTDSLVPRPKLKHFKAGAIGYQNLPNDFFLLMLNSYLNLVTLNLSESLIDDVDLQNVFHQLPRLRKLQIEFCENITENGLIGYRDGSISVTHSLSNLKGLRWLKLDHRDGFKLNCFERLNGALLELIVLSVVGSADFDEDAASSIVSNCPNIEALDMNECRLNLESLSILLKSMSRLETFYFVHFDVKENLSRENLQFSKSLKHLKFPLALLSDELPGQWPSHIHAVIVEDNGDPLIIEPKKIVLF